MPIEIRPPAEDDVAAMVAADGRGFGYVFAPEEVARRRPTLDLPRFRLALDGQAIVGVAGSFALDVSLPGGATVPMGGVTWVSVAATHRRQGVARRLLDAVHADIDDRDEPAAGLAASEGGIYGRFGYGVAGYLRRVSIDARWARLREELIPAPGSVRFLEPGEARALAPELWDRARRRRPGETSRSAAWWDMLFADQAEGHDGLSPSFRLGHRDGYVSYRVRAQWNEGRPGHHVEVGELVAATDEAHAALWHTLLNIDLVGTVTTRRAVAVDDALPFLLTDPRVVRTEGIDDCLWLRPQRPAALLAARRYGTADRLVVEVGDADAGPVRYEVEGAPDGATARRSRRRADLVLDRAALGAIVLGGTRPSVLARARRVGEATPDALRRADAFFAAERQPQTQNHF